MKRTIIIIGAFVLFISMPNARGQSTLNATGGTHTTVDLSEFDWSVGEVALVSTFYGPLDKNIVVTQGLLQNELSTPERAASMNLGQHLQVFPNPASSVVNLQYTSSTEGSLSYRLMDMTGKVLLSHSGTVAQGMAHEQLNIAGLAAATYLLEVTFKDNTGTEAMTPYKIEKLN